jgi:hypothetical protein
MPNMTSDRTVPAIVHEVLRSPGEPLDVATPAFMEPRFGHDFSKVRIRRDSNAAQSADAVKALAYTVARDVVFRAGQYRPETEDGQKLLGHERTPSNGPISIGNADTPREAEAEKVANAVTSGQQSFEEAAIDTCGQYDSALFGRLPTDVPCSPLCSGIVLAASPPPAFTADFGKLRDRISYGDLSCTF